MLTKKGQATRTRIVGAAADLVLARGAAGTSLDDICAGTRTSRSQLFHYFPGGKSDLVLALAAFQAERVLDAQRPWLDSLDTWETWDRWRDSVLAHYGSQPHWGCPIGALSSELAGRDPEAGAQVAAHMDRWRALLRAGIERMNLSGDAETHSLALFASLQGGLLLTQTMQSITPLEAALDSALVALRSHASGARCGH
ncbi:TetR/AcrR family transcriptional regulator [Solirubrobacter ginsenosidimutans]|uniref:TetR/AcrR family transcriptional regulator n=1 Tax=Solirubrobacter ginsenosidimutans TaxID=490573 RepID=A0A9X3MV77_9ACTN|nr:helix-turn-helix domain-containing protein [Solirubrobacter ginsenosidimutans]MDA0163002.1 TetR/AcrR family transcriptional regulator [Solirubrobacter ginsenosidimutans]